MSVQNPITAQQVLAPINDTAAAPSVQFGGPTNKNSGTGIRGDIASVTVSIGGSDKMVIDSTGVTANVVSVSVATNTLSVVTSFLPPRLTTTARDLLTPVKGMIIYNTTDDVHQAYNGAWVDMYA